MATTVGTILVNVIGNASGLKSTLDGAAGTVTRFGANVSRMGSRWSAGVSLPIAGLLVGIAKVGVKFDDEMTKSIAIMDGVDKTMRRKMEDSAMALSGKLRFSAAEIAEGYYDLASAGFTATGAMENIETVAKFAQAGLMKMGTAGEYLAGAVKSLTPELIGAKDEAGAMARVADVLTAANNAALGTVEDFSKALTTRFAQGMATANISLEEGVGLLAAYASQNVRGKEASMQAWMAIRDLQSKAISASGAWEKYGISVYTASGELRKIPDILDQISLRQKGFSKQQILGWLDTGVRPEIPEESPMSPRAKRSMVMELKLQDRSVASLMKVVEKGGMIRDFTDKLQNSFGEAEKVAAKQMESIAAKGEAAFHRLQNAGIRLFRDLKPAIYDAFNLVSDWLDKVDGWVVKFNGLDESTRKWMLSLAGIAVVTGPLLWFLGAIIQLGGFVIAAMQGMATGLTAVSSAMLKVVMAGVPLKRNALGQMVSHFSAAAKAGLADWAAFTVSLGKFWAAVKNVLGLATTLGTRLFALVGIVKLAVIPIWGTLTDDTTNLWNVLKGILVPLGALEVLWKKFGGSISTSLGSWDDWVKTGKNVLEIIGDLATMSAYGLGLIPKLLELIGEVSTEIFTKAVEDVEKAVRAIINGFKKMGVEWKAELEKIPLIGPLFAAAFDLAGSAIDKFWDKAREAFAWIKNASANLLENAANSASWGLYGWAKDFVKGTGDAHGVVAKLRNGVHALGLEVGAIKPLESKLKPFWEFHKGASETPGEKPSIFTEVPGPGFKPPEELDNTRKGIDRVKEAYDQLMGDGGRAWRDVAKAVEEHKEEIFGNADAMDRLWEIYKGVRETVGPSGLTKELDELFATRIGLEDMERLQETFGDLFNDLFNNGEVQTELEKHLNMIQNFVNSRRSLLEDNDMATGIFSPEFFEKYGSQIEQLNKSYSSQSDEVKLMIDEYYKWANAMDAAARAQTNIVKGNEAFAAVVNAHADMAAQVADKSKELADLQLTEGQRTVRGMSRNLEAQQREFDKTNAEMLSSFKYMEGEQLAESIRKFLQMKEMQQGFVDTVYRMDQIRAANAVGIDEKVIRSFKHMTDAKGKATIDLMIRQRVAANQTAKTWSDLAAVFNTVVTFNDPEGNKWVTWLNKISGLMGEATLAGNDFQNSAKGISASFNKGDWKGVASNIIEMAQAIANAWAIMASATEGTNRMQATMGGAMAGAQIGGSTGSGWGAAIGAIVGGAIGFFRSAGRAATEAQQKVRALRQEYFDMLTSFTEGMPEIKEWARIWHAFGVELRLVNSEADVAFNTAQLEEFKKKLEDIRGRFGDLISRSEELGIGLPQDIRDAILEMIELGVVTGDTADMFRRLTEAGEVDFAKMKEAADRIGLAEDKLGKKYNQSRMNAIAKQLINDFDILERGGADTNDILDAMADEINALVGDSKKFGTTIPENMRPWIQRLIDTGRLVDENGEKITDLNGINFGPAIKTQFEEITTALLELIEELKKLPGLFADIRNITLPEIPEGGGGGGGGGGEEGGGEGGGAADRASVAAIRDAYDATMAFQRRASVTGLSASTANRGASVVRDIIVYPVAVGDAMNIDDLADRVSARLPEDISDNKNKIKYAIITAARATTAPRRTRR